jgi:hypothetical protein
VGPEENRPTGPIDVRNSAHPLTHQQKPGGTIPWRDLRAHRAKDWKNSNEDDSNSFARSQPRSRAGSFLLATDAPRNASRVAVHIAKRFGLSLDHASTVAQLAGFGVDEAHHES